MRHFYKRRRSRCSFSFRSSFRRSLFYIFDLLEVELASLVRRLLPGVLDHLLAVVEVGHLLGGGAVLGALVVANLERRNIPYA